MGFSGRGGVERGRSAALITPQVKVYPVGNGEKKEKEETMETTEAQALEQIARWANEYGWKYAVFTRDDVRQACIDLDGDGLALELRVDAVMATRMWVKTLEDAIIREGMECVYYAIEQAKQGV